MARCAVSQSKILPAWLPVLFLVLFNLPLGTGCLSHVPPPATPSRQVPEVGLRPEAPVEGQGQVIIDATNGPASVGMVMSAMTVATDYGQASSIMTRPLCASTPCAVNLPYGTYNIILRGRNDQTLVSGDAIQVGRSASVLRHTMGSARSSPGLYIGGLTVLTLGASGVVVGASTLPIADSETSSSGLRKAAWWSVGIGAGLTAIGAVMMYLGRPQVQPGSSVQWTPDGPPPVAPGDRHVVQVTPTGLQVTFD